MITEGTLLNEIFLLVQIILSYSLVVPFNAKLPQIRITSVGRHT